MRALLYEILKALHNNEDLSSGNIVGTIKQEFEKKIDELYEKWDSYKSILNKEEYELCKEEYDSWQKSGFSLDYQFCGYDTLLRVAAEYGYIDIIKILIESGADVNGKRRYTPLHAAAEGNQQEAIKILIKNGANVHTKDLLERTPLHYAAVRGSESIIRLLIQNGADPWVKDKDGETPVYSYVYGLAFFLSPGYGDGCLAQFEKARNGSLFVRYSTMVFSAIAAVALFATDKITPDAPHIIGAVAIVTAAAFAAGRITYEIFKPSNKLDELNSSQAANVQMVGLFPF